MQNNLSELLTKQLGKIKYTSWAIRISLLVPIADVYPRIFQGIKTIL